MAKLATLPAVAALSAVVCAWSAQASAAGVLRPASTAARSIEIVDHQVHVVVNNGFARTEVRQTFHNPNASALDAVYEFPVPPDAALSEMTIEVGDRTLRGEVVARNQAQTIYDQQQAAGNQAGLATQDSYQRFEFSVANVPAEGDAVMDFVYYEPVNVDAGVGRYLYPLEPGGTDASQFWTGTETTTTGSFSFDLELKSAVPVTEIRVPAVPGAEIQTLPDGRHHVHFATTQASLTQDVVTYYRLEDNATGRLDVIPFRGAENADGTFMMLLTPNLDLPPIQHGTDFVYVLDFSGSMATKLATLQTAIARALSELGPEDRFRLVGFSESAFDLTPLLTTSPADVARAIQALDAQGVLSGTNLYAGLSAGLSEPDPERVTSVFLVTDGVTNEGIVEPVAFDALLRESDLRVYGFLLGNSANWPLMDVIARASGGFYAAVSNADDTLGQVLLAKNKLTHESLHSASLALTGVPVSDTTDFNFGKVYRGQQLAIFGRYAQGGAVRVELSAKMRNKDVSYVSHVSLPDLDASSPELERLWALQRIHGIENQALLGLVPASEAAARVAELGIRYQLVTTETSMLVLDDAGFESAGIDRNNQARSDLEHAAQGTPGNGSGTTGSVSGPTGNGSDKTASGSGVAGVGDSATGQAGGALDPATLALLALSTLVALGRRRKPEQAA